MLRMHQAGNAYESVPRHFVVVAALALLTACAGTARVESAKGLAETGRQYTATMDALAETALERRLDRGVRDLKSIRDVGPTTEPVLAKALADWTENARIFAEQVGLYRAQVKVLAAYFEALDALASANVNGTWVELTDANGRQILARYFTGPDGLYYFRNVSPGNYQLRVSGRAYPLTVQRGATQDIAPIRIQF